MSVEISNKTINVQMNRVPMAWYRKTGVTINGGSVTNIDTGQSSVRPIQVIFEDSNGKEITRSLQPRTVTLSTNYIISTYSGVEILNVTLYYR
jgi:hypothetical protein